MPEPITPERLEWIRRSNQEDKERHGAPWEHHGEPAERHRDELLAEVDRLNAQFAAIGRMNKVADGDWQRELERLKEVAYRQARMISEITESCMAAESDAARHRAQVAVLSAMLCDPDRLADHLQQLRADLAEQERDAEIDRLADGGEL